VDFKDDCVGKAKIDTINRRTAVHSQRPTSAPPAVIHRPKSPAATASLNHVPRSRRLFTYRTNPEINSGRAMSTHQYVRFQAIDKPLDDEQLKFMQQQSSRAQVSRVEFINEYHYSSFGGNALKMMFRGYDIHVEWASYGTRTIMLRLPLGLPWSADQFQRHFCDTEVQWFPAPAGSGGVLQIAGDPESVSELTTRNDMDSFMAALSTLREQLAEGDTRLLYLAWLMSDGELNELEPPVPAGLQSLTPALQELADFFEIPAALLAVAASRSPEAPETTPSNPPLEAWIASRTQMELQQITTRLLQDSAGAVRRELLQQIRAAAHSDPWPSVEAMRTREQLLEAERFMEEQWQRQRIAKDAEDRRKRLEKLAASPAATVARISELVATRKTVEYDTAVILLTDLREALGPELGPEFTSSIAAELRKISPHARSLISKLRSHGFLSK